MQVKKMGLFEEIRLKASKSPRAIVYPEGDDERVVRAAGEAFKAGIVKPILLGDKNTIETLCISNGLTPGDFQLVDPEQEALKEEYYTEIFGIFGKKGVSMEESKELAKDRLNFGCLLVRMNKADGFVGGSVRTTADTVRAAFRIIGLSESTPTLSSCFIMEMDDERFGSGGRFIYADCGVVIDPSPRQLANIAISAAESFTSFIGGEPRVAFLSFSTKGSALDKSIDKIQQALSILKGKKASLAADGEFQFDAAVDLDVAGKKIKGDSPVAGRANVFIFPDLNSGNIAYKITHKLAKARAVGPILQGLKKPANDLSRGCSYEDILDATAITVLQAGSKTQVH